MWREIRVTPIKVKVTIDQIKKMVSEWDIKNNVGEHYNVGRTCEDMAWDWNWAYSNQGHNWPQ